MAAAIHFMPGARQVGSVRCLICACTILLQYSMAAWPWIYTWAWFIVAIGASLVLVPIIERHALTLRNWLAWCFAFMMGFWSSRSRASLWRRGLKLELASEVAARLLPANSPNILLVVLDTVRADRLSLYGYERSTTPNLERLSKRGIRFDLAQRRPHRSLDAGLDREHVHRPLAARAC